MLFLALGAVLAAGQGPPTEFDVKAVYLVKFIQYVDWPASAFQSPTSPLVIGVLGANPFGQVLDEVAKGEMMRDHPLVVRYYRSVRDVGDVQVLYVTSSERSHLPLILAALNERHILTVSDLEGFSKDGGIVRFVVENKKVRFRVNIDAAKRADLQISSKLLQLAEVVRDGENK